MTDKLTIHMIGNAHLDPVWQWRCPAGIDEAIATCRSACDFLDEYPELFITCGEAWVHWWVYEIDPALFARIQRHAADVQPNGTIRLTLLRSPLYLHHEPRTASECHNYPTTDQGVHEFEILLISSESLDLPLIADNVAELANPIVLSENTKGMYKKQT